MGSHGLKAGNHSLCWSVRRGTQWQKENGTESDTRPATAITPGQSWGNGTSPDALFLPFSHLQYTQEQPVPPSVELYALKICPTLKLCCLDEPTRNTPCSFNLSSHLLDERTDFCTRELRCWLQVSGALCTSLLTG